MDGGHDLKSTLLCTNLSLKQMAVQFAAPIPLLTKKITRRSSYAQAGGISNSMATDPVNKLLRPQIP